MSLSEKCKQVRMLLTDVDGVLTDGKLYYDSSGECMKAFNVKDGLICNQLYEQNIEMGIITGRLSKIVEKRAEELNINTVFQNQKDKTEALYIILHKNGLKHEEVAYIGDDINDLPILKSVGLAGSPSDAVDEVKEVVHFVCNTKGGSGAFREFAELILSYKSI